MPTIDPYRPNRVLAGSGQVSINGVPIFPRDFPKSRANGRHFYDQSHILTTVYAEDPGSPWADGNVHLVLIDQEGTVIRELWKNPGVDLECAGGSRWSCRTYVPGVEVYSLVDGIRHDHILIIGISSDGWLAYTGLSAPYGLSLCPPDRQPSPSDLILEGTQVQAEDVQVHPGGAVTWRVGPTIKAYGLPGWTTPVTTVPSFGGLRVVRAVNAHWLLYTEFGPPGRTLLHPGSELTGHIILTDGAPCYRPDLVLRPEGFQVAYADSHQYEPPHLVRTVTIPPSQAPVPLTGSGPGPSSEDIMIPAFSHYGWVAPYFGFSSRYGDTEDPIGNAALIVSDPQNPLVLGQDVARVLQKYPAMVLLIGGRDPVPENAWNQTVGLYAHGGTINELGETVRWYRGNRPELPILAYLDGREWPRERPDWLDDHVRPNIQAYRFPGENLQAFAAALDAVFARVQTYGRPMGMTPRFDDFNLQGSLQQTLECMPHYERWTRAYQLVDVLPFADRRGQGLAFYPELRSWARAFWYAFPERPNRYDYWIPDGTDAESRMRNKLGQSRIAVTLEAHDREYLLGLMDGDAPDPNPDPSPEPGAYIPPEEMSDVVLEVWADYGGQNLAAMLNEIAWRGNYRRADGPWGLSRKTSGNQTEQPHTGEKIATDIVQLGPTDPETGHADMYDCFVDGGRSPGWSPAEQHNNPDRIWIAAVRP